MKFHGPVSGYYLAHPEEPSVYITGDTVLTEPVVMGHEFSGEVAALGAGVTSPAVGTLVAVEPAIPCRECTYCWTGEYPRPKMKPVRETKAEEKEVARSV